MRRIVSTVTGSVAPWASSMRTRSPALATSAREVSGANGVDEPIGAGEAVFLHEAEDHGMKSEAELTVLILQGANLDRFRARPKRAV